MEELKVSGRILSKKFRSSEGLKILRDYLDMHSFKKNCLLSVDNIIGVIDFIEICNCNDRKEHTKEVFENVLAKLTASVKIACDKESSPKDIRESMDTYHKSYERFIELI